MIRITGGEYSSRQLIEPGTGETSRPYQARTREAVCNLLRGWFEDAQVLDLFAGVGTMGLEAVSRGATNVVLVEKSRETFARLQQNIERLGCGDRARAVHGDALSPHIAAIAPRPVDLLFVDPPYALMTDENARPLVLQQITSLCAVMAEPAFAVLRSPLGPDEVDLAIDDWNGPEPHHYGSQHWVLLYEPARAAVDKSAPTAQDVDSGS